MDDTELVCRTCRRKDSFTAPVSVVLVFAPHLAKPHPLIPDGDYRVCAGCEALYKFVDRAVHGHPVTKDAGTWSKAIVLFADGQGVEVKPERKRASMAMA